MPAGAPFDVSTLCPSRLAIAIHRKLLALMDEDPSTFPPMSMCHRLRGRDHSLALAYGADHHVISMADARDYLRRLLGGHSGRHDDPSAEPAGV